MENKDRKRIAMSQYVTVCHSPTMRPTCFSMCCVSVHQTCKHVISFDSAFSGILLILMVFSDANELSSAASSTFSSCAAEQRSSNSLSSTQADLRLSAVATWISSSSKKSETPHAPDAPDALGAPLGAPGDEHNITQHKGHEHGKDIIVLTSS